MLFPRCAVVLTLLLLLISVNPIAGSNGVSEEEFSEELLLKPLPDRKLLAHFHFETTVPSTTIYGRHHHLFPKAIYQLVQKFHIREMELSFTQGRWDYELWGGFDPISSSNAKPPGVELWATFDVPHDEVDTSWKNLTHALSGLFCASINFLESSTAYSAPDWGFRPFSGSFRYGSLPREAVCTENLTPWLKLLPCRDKAGIAVLMDRPSLYSGFYHSQRLHLTLAEVSSVGMSSGIVLEQTLSVVLQPSSEGTYVNYYGDELLQPSWSLSSIFGKKISGSCTISKNSSVYLLLERGLVASLKNLHKENQNSNSLGSEDSWTAQSIALTVVPDRVFKEINALDSNISSILYMFSIDKFNSSVQFDLGLEWKYPVVWSSSHAPLHADRYLMGSGNERGAIAIYLRSNRLSESDIGVDVTNNRCTFRVNVFQIVPWYVKVYYHTLQVFLDEKPVSVTDVIEKLHVAPSKDKLSPGVMELLLKFNCTSKSSAITIEFDKGFLHIDEYPPDANQGFDIPSAIISFPEFTTSLNFVQNSPSPMLQRLQERTTVLSYTEVLLVPLATPDFSMPYNVITITCTVFALYFGTLLNVLRRRVSEEERLLKRRAATHGKLSQVLSKIFSKLRRRSREPPEQPLPSSLLTPWSSLVHKVILVAGIAVGVHYFLQWR